MLKEAILHATLPVKFVLFILFTSSVVVWALIIYNILKFKKIEEKDEEFIDFFWAGGVKDILKFYTRYDDFSPSPIAKMCAEISASLSKGKLTPDRISRVISQEVKNSIEEVSKFQFIFATVSSSAPFIGLFGTVWGIMHSFHQIGKMGRAGLEVVAPGISEALFTTAMGLFAAIPSVIAYNFFQNKIKTIRNKLESFATELENLLIRKEIKQKQGDFREIYQEEPNLQFPEKQRIIAQNSQEEQEIESEKLKSKRTLTHKKYEL